MRYLSFIILLLAFLISSCGTTERMGAPDTDNTTKSTSSSSKKIEDGKASWYGPNFHGKLTANGEKYDMYALTAAHRTLPFNSIIKVKNLDNGQSVTVRINDRGPYAKNRIIDLSKKAAQEIDMLGAGTARVSLILMEGDLENSRVTDLKTPTYTVQLASYRKKDKAFSHSRKISGSRVETIILDSQKVYRVYYGRYTDKDTARQKKRMLAQKGYKGYVKQIEN
ncbi:rare lipoprotein A [Fodinibius salinus]|uniref:Probable endolytic peptidoglycan transglycosylase RlpA n=1 Tax=Fodinibius salinus TaxID=860790 RepID=A0A5D3YJ39_9BACT|nr:septal ring lytic transglycosylase RlpA family protein [Fodinibius salinus]TYP92520.1 rare lipoprotein A [Fodinibius salinus]